MVLARDDVGTITFEQWGRREQADEPPVECPPPLRPRPPPVKRRSWVDELERRACRCRGCGEWVFDGPYCDWCDQGGSVTEAETVAIIDVLCSQALADHLGDVRDAEDGLWKLLGAPKLPYGHPAWDTDSAWKITRARLEAAGLALPRYLRGDEDDEDDE